MVKKRVDDPTLGRLCQSRRRDRVSAVRVFALTASIGVLTASGYIANPDGQIRLNVAESIVTNADVSLRSDLADRRFGNSATGRDGKSYAVFSIGTSVLLVPAALLARLLSPLLDADVDDHAVGMLLASFNGPLFAALIAVVIFWFGMSIGYSRRVSVILALVYFFCTFVWPHAKDGFEHLQASFFATLGLLACWNSRQDRTSYFLIGVAFGIAILFRYTIVLMAPAALYLVLTKQVGVHYRWLPKLEIRRLLRPTLFVLLGMVPFVLVCLTYNWMRWGDPIQLGYALAWGQGYGLGILPSTPTDSQMAGSVVLEILCPLASPWKGLIFFAPVVCLWPWATCRLWRYPQGRRLSIAVALVFTAYFGFEHIAGFRCGGGFWSWGPRTLVETVPLLVLTVGCLASQATTRIRVVFIVVLSVSMILQVLAVTVTYRTHLYRIAMTDSNLATAVSNPWVSSETFNAAVWSWRDNPLEGQVRSIFHVLGSESVSKTDHTHVLADDYLDKHNFEPSVVRHRLNSWPTSVNFDFWWVYAWIVAPGARTLIMFVVAAVSAIGILSAYLLVTRDIRSNTSRRPRHGL